MSLARRSTETCALSWRRMPDELILKAGEAHLLRVCLDLSPRRLSQLSEVLSSDERDRAARFFSRRDESRFVARRGLLRELLGRYLQIPPGRLRFSYGPRGKPELARTADGRPLYFNLAHSNATAVIAVTCEGEVGIDFELVRMIPDLADLVATVCSEREQAEWQNLSCSQRLPAFFDYWTRKEAFLKGLGEGLHKPPNEIEVSLRRSGPGDSFCVFDRGCEVPAWSLRSLSAADYALALALKNSRGSAQICCWDSRPE